MKYRVFVQSNIDYVYSDQWQLTNENNYFSARAAALRERERGREGHALKGAVWLRSTFKIPLLISLFKGRLLTRDDKVLLYVPMYVYTIIMQVFLILNYIERPYIFQFKPSS